MFVLIGQYSKKQGSITAWGREYKYMLAHAYQGFIWNTRGKICLIGLYHG